MLGLILFHHFKTLLTPMEFVKLGSGLLSSVLHYLVALLPKINSILTNGYGSSPAHEIRVSLTLAGNSLLCIYGKESKSESPISMARSQNLKAPYLWQATIKLLALCKHLLLTVCPNLVV
jgi:hypothetical protein